MPIDRQNLAMESDILCQRDGAVATVTLFNPDKLNAHKTRI